MADELARGREAFRRRAWNDAFAVLAHVDRGGALGPDDLERLGISAYMSGRELEFERAFERLHRAHAAAGEAARAARAAFWLAFGSLLRGELGPASGWVARGRRLVESIDCVEHGYLALPGTELDLARGAGDSALAAARDAVAIGLRFGDPELTAAARHVEGRALIRLGRIDAGLALLDEAMVAVVAGELSPLLTGLVYCSVLEACHQVFALARAREWTAAFARWCAEQPDSTTFSGICLVRRGEMLELAGAWADALSIARRAFDWAERAGHRPLGGALYLQGEIHRLRGELDAAERDYREASRLGCEPLPGLAQLLLARGRTRAAQSAIRRALDATADPLARARLLPARVEIALAAGALAEAQSACTELERVAASAGREALGAVAAESRGAVELAGGRARPALAALRRALEGWQRLEAPHAAARVRVLVARACRELGDEESGQLELAAARAVFEALGAEPDLALVEWLALPRPEAPSSRLTARELQVLRSIASGKTNRVIAGELALSERTIDRHVSNILTKLDVRSRTAATAWAYDRGLL
jgi:DNA-binding CsgD family transcriptional regulator/tetratricopeptide (TPR) repeat protein